MKQISKELLYIESHNLTSEIFQEDCIFFDIETTGFSPASSNLYLIGCLRKKNNTLIIDQFFAENKDDEKIILEKFTELLHPYKALLSFNGIGFDIPYIKAKCNSYGISDPFGQFEYLDIFKQINTIKFLLKLPNYKQKTIEDFLGIHRDDKYSGGELINIYHDYVKTHDTQAEELLLLHNYEDVIGMLDLLPILSYNKVLMGNYKIENAEISTYTNYDGEPCSEIIITLKNDYTVPKRVSHQFKAFYLTMNKDITKIRIPIFEGELKFFYPNYKDYFYLPVEDMAIHKSVASFVDKEYREKASAKNCYTKKQGKFLPQYSDIFQPSFKADYKDKVCYFELSDDFTTSQLSIQEYLNHIFEQAIKNN